MVGYIQPTGRQINPRGLTLPDFLQTVLTGISGLDGHLVRLKAQIDPPKSPQHSTNWLSFEINTSNADVNPYTSIDTSGNTVFQRHETLTLQCSFFGPEALTISDLVHDGFTIQQNRYWLTQAKMAFVEMGQAMRMPDLVNERFLNRYERSITLRRQIMRLYPIPVITSATGQIHTVVGNEDYLTQWATP